jgi:RHS repeat-associated protein
VTDQAANIVARHDYLPFGEEIGAGVAGCDSNFGRTDFVNQKFTGQLRDSETGLDFFNARYLSAAQGRFTTSDPMNAGADLLNPQSWNGYGYVGNNPLSSIDPSGMDAMCFMALTRAAEAGFLATRRCITAGPPNRLPPYPAPLASPRDR